MKTRRSKPALKLYWVFTNDHFEDWFVVACSKRDAIRHFEHHEGYPREEIEARLVAKVPDSAGFKQDDGPFWAQDSDLEACGGIRVAARPYPTDERSSDMAAILGQGRKVFQFGSSIFTEGDIITEIRKLKRAAKWGPHP